MTQYSSQPSLHFGKCSSAGTGPHRPASCVLASESRPNQDSSMAPVPFSSEHLELVLSALFGGFAAWNRLLRLPELEGKVARLGRSCITSGCDIRCRRSDVRNTAGVSRTLSSPSCSLDVDPGIDRQECGGVPLGVAPPSLGLSRKEPFDEGTDIPRPIPTSESSAFESAEALGGLENVAKDNEEDGVPMARGAVERVEKPASLGVAVGALSHSDFHS